MLKADPLSLWLPELRRPSRHARLRLFCFPYAGGAASAFARWPDRLPASIEVRPLQLPGRWNRMREAPFTRFDDLARALGDVLTGCLDRPFVFFGHSMGALLAFEAARSLQERGLPMPLHVFVSGRRAPHLPDTDLPAPDLDDAAFIEKLRELNGTPAEVLDRPELMQILVPIIRADFSVCRSYACAAGPPLSCPLTVFGGVEDAESAEGRLEAWAVHTRDRCAVHRFPGDHFYVNSAEALLLRALSASLDGLLAATFSGGIACP